MKHLTKAAIKAIKIMGQRFPKMYCIKQKYTYICRNYVVIVSGNVDTLGEYFKPAA